jgi:uncharacterized iron-regulated membrane protein
MFDPNEGQNSGLMRPIWIMLAALGIVMTSGFIAGFTAQNQNDGGGAFTGIAAAIFAAAILAIIGYGYWTWQNAKAMKVPGENLTPRERRRRYILSGCIFLGWIMGIGLPIMFEGGESAEAITIFSNSPLRRRRNGRICLSRWWLLRGLCLLIPHTIVVAVVARGTFTRA